MKKWLLVFRVTALLEGVSYLLLLFIAVPIKYVYEDPQYVKILGMPHGVLFMAYVIIALFIMAYMKWNLKTLGIVLLASIIPFGTFYIEKNYLKTANA